MPTMSPCTGSTATSDDLGPLEVSSPVPAAIVLAKGRVRVARRSSGEDMPPKLADTWAEGQKSTASAPPSQLM
jgi:hypothetical protein